MANPPISHVIVLMLENRSFDSVLGYLYPASDSFRGLTGTESNIWHRLDGGAETIPIWTAATDDPAEITIPDPDPGELFTDILQQRTAPTPMGGFVDNYMAQPAATPPRAPNAVLHAFAPAHLPVITALARAFGVSDCWHASAPCQTWPNRFFAHTGSAGGYVNNTADSVPYLMDTAFNRLSDAGKSWRIYFHDIPQAATLGRLWPHFGNFRFFEESFAADAAAGTLPNYSFIEPRYFTDALGNALPNDMHPPHNVAHGEVLIAAVYNALRSSPLWRQSLLIIVTDEHGGLYDHVTPPAAVPPGGPAPDGFTFDSFGIRVPALIISPFIAPGSIIRPNGETPFDHTSIFKTLQELFGLASLTPRSDAAPSLLPTLSATPDNDGPMTIAAPDCVATTEQVATAAQAPQNNLQESLSRAAVQLPTAGADFAAHIARLANSPVAAPAITSVRDAAVAVRAAAMAFLGRA